MTSRILSVSTPAGLGRVTLIDDCQGPQGRQRPSGLLLLGHGAGGARWTPDIDAVVDAAVAAGWCVALVDQPWRLAGKRVGPGPAHLDLAWVPLVAAAVEASRAPGPVVVGGRSAGARVACRTCATVGADAVLALSFPLYPPGRPEASRAAELLVPSQAGLPLRVIQGSADRFGTPTQIAAVLGDGDVVAVDGTHALSHVEPVAAAAVQWLTRLAAGR